MANRFLERIMHGPADDGSVPLGGTRAEAIQRLQIGASGIFVIVLLVALADVVRDRADQTDAEAVPEAAATIAAEVEAPPQSDPLADAGVVPDLPADPEEAAEQTDPVLPEQGTGEATQGEGSGNTQ